MERRWPDLLPVTLLVVTLLLLWTAWVRSDVAVSDRAPMGGSSRQVSLQPADRDDDKRCSFSADRV